MIKIDLMRNDPIVYHGEGEIMIRGVQRRLLRLLVLREGKRVSNEAIGRLTGRECDAAAGKVRDLRQALQPLQLVENDRATGYCIPLNNIEVDAFTYRDGVDAILAVQADYFAGQEPLEAILDEIAKLEALEKMWVANPATDLPVEEGLEEQFTSLRQNARVRLNMARLATQQEAHRRRAISDLENMTHTEAVGSIEWRLLLLAHHAFGSIQSVSKTVERINEYYSSHVPLDVDTTARGVLQQGFHNPFGTPTANAEIGMSSEGRSSRSEESALSVATICQVLGITTTSHLSLTKSELTPAACIKRTRRRLWFSGVLASKWVVDGWLRSEFDKLLSRLDEEQGEVRFMMINPRGEGYERLKELRRGALSDESVEPIRKLAAAHPSMEVRVFENLPSFRIVIIDDDVVSFSPYRLGADAYNAGQGGWEAPHVVLDPLAPYPLAEAFTLLFDETWNNATPLEQVP